MTALRPETRCKRIIKQITPLVTFLKRDRPTCRRIHLYRADWDSLYQAGDVARAHGFQIEGDAITYQGFSLEPLDPRGE